jgi:AcrR family transcriptional regulator
VTTDRPRARRRTTEEIRGLILAARELFDERGYDGTTTKDIAERAGVYERLVYTNFGSKAGLFDAAVVEPLSLLVAVYLEGWNDHPEDTTPEQRIDRLVRGLFEFALKNRDALSKGHRGARGVLQTVTAHRPAPTRRQPLAWPSEAHAAQVPNTSTVWETSVKSWARASWSVHRSISVA